MENHTSVEMSGNQAEISGDDIYGASKLQCNLYANGESNTQEINDVFYFLFSTENERVSSVSSTPYHVCFCKLSSPKVYCLGAVNRSVFSWSRLHSIGS